MVSVTIFLPTVANQEADRQLYGDTITMPEIARLIGVHRNTVYGLVRAGYRKLHSPVCKNDPGIAGGIRFHLWGK